MATLPARVSLAVRRVWKAAAGTGLDQAGRSTPLPEQESLAAGSKALVFIKYGVGCAPVKAP